VRIAILSDTHDRLPQQIPELLVEADEIWHLGDVCQPLILETLQLVGPPVRVVRGNCDDCLDWPLALDFELAGLRIHLTHIPPRIAPRGVNLLFHGHTHVPRNERIGPTRFFNPGCITRPNRGAPASWAWLELHRGYDPAWRLEMV
jgi:putative phosphoesterase